MSEPAIKLFLGAGIGSPVETDDSGALRLASYEDSVRQSIWLILGCARGERVMRPDFGCGIHDLVFGAFTSATGGQVAAAVRDALLRFEPRIDVQDIQVEPSGNGEILLISIDYNVRATNNAFNLVYPFYLDGGASAV
jgi:uncharacterized protein